MCISRRDFLRKLALSGMAVSLGRICPFERLAHAQVMGRTVVLIQLDGGADGLHIAPSRLGSYFDRRPTIAIPESEQLSLHHSQVGLHPKFAHLHQRYTAGDLAVIQQVAIAEASRSHADSKKKFALARTERSTDKTGWLGRMLDQMATENPENSFLGWSFAGNTDVLTAQNYTSYTTGSVSSGYGFRRDYRVTSGEHDYRHFVIESILDQVQASDLESVRMSKSLRAIYDSIDVVRDAAERYGDRPVSYPNESLARDLKDIATLIHAGRGRVFVARQGGHDTHGDQISRENQLFERLDDAIGAFLNDMEQIGRYNDVMVLVYGDFGRNTFENGSGGTDHGVGQTVLMVGGGVSGGVYGETPNSAIIANERWLQNSVDMRNVFREVGRFMGYNESLILPETYESIDLNLI